MLRLLQLANAIPANGLIPLDNLFPEDDRRSITSINQISFIDTGTIKIRHAFQPDPNPLEKKLADIVTGLEHVKKVLRERLWTALMLKGWTLNDLAKKAKVNATALSFFIGGGKDISAESMLKTVRALDMPEIETLDIDKIKKQFDSIRKTLSELFPARAFSGRELRTKLAKLIGTCYINLNAILNGHKTCTPSLLAKMANKLKLTCTQVLEMSKQEWAKILTENGIKPIDLEEEKKQCKEVLEKLQEIFPREALEERRQFAQFLDATHIYLTAIFNDRIPLPTAFLNRITKKLDINPIELLKMETPELKKLIGKKQAEEKDY